MMRFPLRAKLKDGSPVYLDYVYNNDINCLYDIFKVIIEEGNSYPHITPPQRDEFAGHWLRQATSVGAYLEDAGIGRELIGAFYLKPNWIGKSKHVANAGFVVAPSWRRKGVGWMLGATMLTCARKLGYRGVIFNLVFAGNHVALRLWEGLGFSRIGVVPRAVCVAPGVYEDAVIMFRSLEDESEGGSEDDSVEEQRWVYPDDR